MVNEELNASLFYAFDTAPPVLYHYTSMEALLSIVGSERMRATHIRYLNDITEAAWMWGSVTLQLKARRENESNNLGRGRISALIDMIDRRRLCTDFVASFSENADDLSQWRAYCPMGNGFSIGFDSDALRTQWVSDPAGGKPAFVGGRLSKVRYLSEESTDLDKLLDGILEISPSLEGVQGFTGPLTGPGIALAWLSVMSSSFKHAAFKAENEWRMLLLKPHKPMPFQRFRAGKPALIPYIEVELNKDLNSAPVASYIIKEVVVSPTPDPSLSVDALKSLFLSLGHPDVEVRPSAIPYRHW